MNEYLDRAELIIELQKKYDALYGRRPDFYMGYQMACGYVENFQTADVAPVRHGHWIDCEDEYSSYVRCSECGDEYTNWEADCAHTDFCPGCGADMRDGGTVLCSG